MAEVSKCRVRENDWMTMTGGKYLVAFTCLLLLCGCSVLPKPEPEVLNLYVLEVNPQELSPRTPDANAPVMIISVPRAQGGYDTARMAYVTQPYGLRYFTRSRWADTPANMLAPLLADALQAIGGFSVLYAAPGSISASFRLDTELIRFHQDFTRQPSVLQITLRATLVDLRSNRVLATHRYEISEPADSEDAYGGVVAANKAVHRLVEQLADFCLAAVH